jgi:hypothetical protein
MKTENQWAEADEVSDRVIEVLNARIPLVDVDQILVGVCLGLLGFLKTIPRGMPWPETLLRLEEAAGAVVENLVELGSMRGREGEEET